MIGSLFVGLLVAMVAAALTNRGEKMGCIGKIFLGLAGAWVGQLLFGEWGPHIADTAILPSILGAIILLAIFWERGS